MKKKIIRNNPQYYAYPWVWLFLFDLIATTMVYFIWNFFNLGRVITILFFTLFFILAFILALVSLFFSFLFSKKKRKMIITENYVKFPGSKYYVKFPGPKRFKYKKNFKKEEIKKIKIFMPRYWQIAKYLPGGPDIGLTVVNKDEEKIKETGQDVDADFNPREILKALNNFGYKVEKVEENFKNYFIKK